MSQYQGQLDTGEMRAIVRTHFPHLSYGWLRWLNMKIGAISAENGGYFDLFSPWRGEKEPRETRLNIIYRGSHEDE